MGECRPLVYLLNTVLQHHKAKYKENGTQLHHSFELLPQPGQRMAYLTL